MGKDYQSERVQNGPTKWAPFEALKDIVKPVTADELPQLVYCTRWMQSSIPILAQRAACLVNLLEMAYKRAGSPKK